MTIRNNKNGRNSVNYKVAGGFVKNVEIGSGKTVSIPDLMDYSNVINKGDFARGFLSIVEKAKEKKIENISILEKAKKQAKEYVDKKKKKKKKKKQ